jgi:His Kinase A (phospho-acceptor) domain/Histidine kinase-, DNA gyrase B-, and HSP90-like ATPase
MASSTAIRGVIPVRACGVAWPSVLRQGTWIVNIETPNAGARTTEYGPADQGSSARHFAAAAEPVFIFDGKIPVLVWANEAALAFVGHVPSAKEASRAQLPHLDRAMPAMTRLRALTDQDCPAAGVRLDLVFWTAHGARNLSCHCRRATFAFAQEALIVHGGAADAQDKGLAAPHAPSRPATKAAAMTPRSGPARLANAPRQKTGARRPPSPKDKSNGREPAPPPPTKATEAATASTKVLAATLRPGFGGDAVALREIARQIQSATQSATASQSATRRPARPATPPVSEVTAALPPGSSPGHPEPDFLSQIGHEIRTPLNSILGFAEIMREERLGPIGNDRYKTYAADIHDSALHAVSLINDLLDLSRLEAGGMPLDPVEVDVAGVIAQAAASLQPAAGKAGVVLAAPLGRPLPKLVCDARCLKQMLLNLLSNAIKQTDSGGAVWITAATSDDGGLVVRVQDTGVGMSADDVAIALQPYRQVGAAERRAGGTGLGLPLTKAMAEANGGRLVLERIAGGGLAALLVFGLDRVTRA